MSKPRLLDLFSGAGGSARGYQLAGFYVVGVDINPQPRYAGEEFHQADAFEYLAEHYREFDAIHASPPCQGYCLMNKGLLQSMGIHKAHPMLIEPTRQALQAAGLPYVIENVEQAPLINPLKLCGSSFGLLVQRHRLFESNVFLFGMPCLHSLQVADKPALHRHNKNHSRVVGVYGNGRGRGDNKELWQRAMDIDWMTRSEMAQAIPPAYTEFIGLQLWSVLHA